jgi:hypothetical protein
MSKVLPSKWGLKLIDALVILILLALVVKLVAPTSGFSIWLTQGFNLAGATLQWFAGGIQQLFKAL